MRNLLCLLLVLPLTAQAWGQRGHGAIGMLAVEQLSEPTRLRLADILGSTDLDDVVGACFWPDIWRGMGDGYAETARWHYVNVDPDSKAYNRERDCADGRCVTETVNTQASVLGDANRSREERRVAFKFLCHMVGDLHQPLHVGYADDRGGNDITIRYRGESMNLHTYWDAGVIGQHVETLAELVDLLRARPDRAPETWQPGDTRLWTNESFALTRNFAYPATRTVDETFEKRSWQVIQQQLDAAAGRLAVILEVTLGNE
jgi:hypothetical protein